MELDITALDLLPGQTEEHLRNCTITCEATCRFATCRITGVG